LALSWSHDHDGTAQVDRVLYCVRHWPHLGHPDPLYRLGSAQLAPRVLLVLGILLLLIIISGVVLNTISLVREIHRNEQKDAFINAVTHELKTPVASIRLYLETLQTRAVDEEKRKEFYRIMLEDSDRLLATIEQVLRTGRMGAAGRGLNLVRVDLDSLVEECIVRARAIHRIPPESLTLHSAAPVSIVADLRKCGPRCPT